MLEYMFFDAALRDHFVAFARERGVACAEKDDGMGLVVAVPEDVSAELGESLESCYDELLEQQAEQVDQAEGEASRQAAGVHVTLASGRRCLVRLDPGIANRLLAAFTPEEVGVLIQGIARELEEPRSGPLCRS